MKVSDRETVEQYVVTTGDCPSLGRVVAIQTDQSAASMSEIQFLPLESRHRIPPPV
jgi:hypothetical protein